MSGFSLSEEQKAVVENRGGALLVSAAAGSGKTRVLVERLFHYIEHEQCNVNDFLIITFTRAAASELRGRIAEELHKRLGERPGDRHLRRQLMLLYRTEIKTIDAFCSGLLRENVHLLPEDARGRRLSSGFRTLEEREATVLKASVLEKTLDEYYETWEQNGGSPVLADSFGFGRSDDQLGLLVTELFFRTQSHAYPERWLSENQKRWERIAAGEEEPEVFIQPLLHRFADKAEFWAKQYRRTEERFAAIYPLEHAYGEAYRATAEQLSCLAVLAKEGNWAALQLCEDPFVKMKPLSCKPPKGMAPEDFPWQEEELKAKAERYKEQRARATAEVRAQLKLFREAPESYCEDLRASAPAMIELLGLTERFARAYREEKTRRNAADFSDQEHDVLIMLYTEDGEKTELADRVSARYREIMVDEYQDTNEVQNLLFSAISKEEKNLFTVGDVKQSIYRFRLADPEIFLSKYLAYPDAARAAEGEGRKIVLSRNYRSRAEVLEAVNFIFRNILSRDFGGMDYGEAEKLHLGKTDYFENPEAVPEFHLLHFSTAQEEVETGKRAEAEARFVAERIESLLKSGYCVQGGDGAPRRVRPEDIVVLMRTKGRFALYQRTLQERNIPCSAESEDGFYESLEIAVCFQLLQIIDNPHEDVPLISVLSSPLYGFTPDELARIRAKTKEGDFYTALKASEDPHAQEFLTHLAALRTVAEDRSITELLCYLYDEENLLGIFGACEGGEERRQRLKLFLQHARALEQAGYRDLFSFVSELRERLAADAAPPTASKGGQAGVRLMSIHSSKGLEFPVVILSDLSHTFNENDCKRPVLIHSELGLGPQYIDLKRRIRYPTLAHVAVAEKLRSEAKAEEERVLYVAMTRAREKLILVMSMINAEKGLRKLTDVSSLPVEPGVLSSARSLGEWLLLPLLQREEAAPLYEFSGLPRENEPCRDAYPWRITVTDLLPYAAPYHRRGDGAERESGAAEQIPFDRELLSFRYPYMRDTELATVISASSLHKSENPTAQPHRREIRRPAFLTGETALSGAEAGTATHLLLQYLDLSVAPESEALDREIDRISKEQRMTEAQVHAVRREEVLRFLASPLAEELRTAKELHREYTFASLLDARRIDRAASEGEEILLHGVIDCWYIDSTGKTVVLDFKTDRVYGEALTERAETYRPQVEIYAEALSAIYERPVDRKILYFFSENRTVELST